MLAFYQFCSIATALESADQVFEVGREIFSIANVGDAINAGGRFLI
jgi:hypothetical protein